jgi:hypothetical protein
MSTSDRWDMDVGTSRLYFHTVSPNHPNRPKPNEYSEKVVLREKPDGSIAVRLENDFLSDLTAENVAKVIRSRYGANVRVEHFLMDIVLGVPQYD